MSPAELRSLGTGLKTYSILRSNVYGWFERIDTGLYGVTARGKAELAGYPELAAHYSGLLKGKRAARPGAVPKTAQTGRAAGENTDASGRGRGGRK